MSILHSSVVHLTDLVSLRGALLDAGRDTVTHRATSRAINRLHFLAELRLIHVTRAKSGMQRMSKLRAKDIHRQLQIKIQCALNKSGDVLIP